MCTNEADSGGASWKPARGGTDGCSFEAVADPDPPLLLANSFNQYVKTPERLTRQLDVCAAAARTVKVFRLTSPTGARPGDVAVALDHHLTQVIREETA